MPTSRLSVVIQHLMAHFGPDAGGMTDGELLARFLSSRDDNALAALVRRHAPMVWGVCCRLLQNHHDAEDAFQATFLVLVRKAADVPSQAVANWLYGVARQTAVRLRALSAKRGRREKQVVNMPEPANRSQGPGVRSQGSGVSQREWNDLQSVLDEELSRLPDHYRGVIVLCDLEGMTRKEAARQLAIPEGSVASRLARARVMLAKRLTRRGVAFSGGSVAAVLSAGSASASAPPALVASTIKAASLLAAGQAAGVVSAKVAALTEGMVKAMFVTKIKSVLAVALVAGLALAGAAGLIYQTQAGEQAKEEQPAAKKGQKKGEEKNATTWQERTTWQGHVAKVNRLAFSPDGKTLASASDDSTVKVWKLATGKELVGVKEPDGGGVRGVAFAPDGKTFATAGGDKAVRLWDAEKGTQIQQFGGHTGATYSVAFSPDGKTLVSGGGSANYPEKGQTGYGEIRLWDPATGKERTSLQSHTWPVAHLAFTPDGKTLISGGYDNTIKLWDWDGKAQPQERLTITVGQGQGIYDMALSPDGKTLVVASEGTVKLWDVATGKESDTVLEKSEYRDGLMRTSVAFAPDGKTVAASSAIQEWEDKDKKFAVQRRSDVMLWDVATGKLREKLRVDEPVTSLTFSSDGKILVAGCKGKMRIPKRPMREDDIETEKRGAVKLFELKKGPAEQPKAKQAMTKEEKLRVLIDKVLAAHGGEDKLNKLTSFTMTAKHSNGETQHYFVQPPKNFRWETTHRDRMSKRIVILFPEGRRWWTKAPNEDAKEFIPTGLEPLSIEGWLDYVKFFGPRQVLRLKDADYKVALLDEEARIGDRAAAGVQVTGPRYKQKMYFDTETHLLLKSFGVNLREVTYSDYKKFDGIPIAQKEHDDYFEPEVTDFRAVDKLDARLFEQP